MKTIKVVAAVIRDGDRIFSTQRGYGEYKDWWEFPGGKIEAGETPQEALKREIREELTAEITVGNLIKTIEYDYSTFHLSMDCFWAEVESGRLVLKEAEAAKWLGLDELDSVEWLPADLELIDLIKRELSQTQTLEYYEKNADRFAEGTIDIDFSDVQKRFAKYLPAGGYILDFGCGAGRDSKGFLQQGFKVVAIDGSKNLCVIASKNTGLKVKHLLFQELNECEKYDGIWACASILHLPKDELKDVLDKMVRATKAGGHIYTSFKYGVREENRNGRFFADFTEDTFKVFISNLTEICIIEEWISTDVRPGRDSEKWLNIILKKVDTV